MTNFDNLPLTHPPTFGPRVRNYSLWDPLTTVLLILSLLVAGTPTVTANRTGWNSILVSWTAPSPEPHGYEVFYETASAGMRLSGGTTSNTELTLTGLTLGETYSIFVVAFAAEGDPVLPSAHSNTALITIREYYKDTFKLYHYFLL